MYKNLFEKLKKQSKKLYVQNKFKKCKNNIKKTRKIVGKFKINWYFP